MEAQPLPDGRTKLLSRRKDRLIELSLLNALYRGPTGEDAIHCFRDTVRITYGEAWSLKEELSLISVDLFGFPPNMSEENGWRYREVMPTEARKTDTAWDEMPKIDAELLLGSRVAYVLARGELSIFAGAIDEMLENLAPRRNESDHAEVRLVMGRI